MLGEVKGSASPSPARPAAGPYLASLRPHPHPAPVLAALPLRPSGRQASCAADPLRDRGKDHGQGRGGGPLRAVTGRILEQLEQGARPWTKSWSAGHLAGRVIRPLRATGSTPFCSGWTRWPPHTPPRPGRPIARRRRSGDRCARASAGVSSSTSARPRRSRRGHPGAGPRRCGARGPISENLHCVQPGADRRLAQAVRVGPGAVPSPARA